MIKKAEPLSKQQMNMFVETAETLKEQVETSTDRLKDLVGYDPKMLDQAKAMVANHPVVEKADVIKQKIESEVAKSKFVKKAEKMSNKFRNDITKTIDEVKNKIEDYAEDVVEDIQEKVDDFIGTKEVVTKKESTKKKL
jgi:formate dehydrogenase maturation protein FdhE